MNAASIATVVMALPTCAQNGVAPPCSSCSSWPACPPASALCASVCASARALATSCAPAAPWSAGGAGRWMGGRPASSSGRVTSSTISSAARGSAGINQAYSTILQLRYRRRRRAIWPGVAPDVTERRLPAHQINLADINRVPAPIDGDDHRQRDSGLGGGHGDDEDGEDLASQANAQGSLVDEARCEPDESDVDGVEHDLDAHQNADRVAAAQRAKQANAEQNRAQHQHRIECDHRAQSSFVVSLR